MKFHGNLSILPFLQPVPLCDAKNEKVQHKEKKANFMWISSEGFYVPE